MIDIFLPSRIVDTEAQLLDALREGSEVRQEITDNFAPLMKDIRIYFFWEQEKTDLGYKLDYVSTGIVRIISPLIALYTNEDLFR